MRTLIRSTLALLPIIAGPTVAYAAGPVESTTTGAHAGFGMVGAILSGTPWWVALVFILVLFLGARRLRPSTRPVAGLTVAPVLFAVWGIAGLATGGGGALCVAGWLLAAAAASAGGWTAAAGVRRVRRDGALLLAVPGSAWPMLIILAMFVGKYAVAVLLAMQAAHADTLRLAGAALSGAGAGYFGAWLLRAVLRLRRAGGAVLAG